jgi:hypothetical protein
MNRKKIYLYIILLLSWPNLLSANEINLDFKDGTKYELNKKLDLTNTDPAETDDVLNMSNSYIYSKHFILPPNSSSNKCKNIMFFITPVQGANLQLSQEKILYTVHTKSIISSATMLPEINENYFSFLHDRPASESLTQSLQPATNAERKVYNITSDNNISPMVSELEVNAISTSYVTNFINSSSSISSAKGLFNIKVCNTISSDVSYNIKILIIPNNTSLRGGAANNQKVMTYVINTSS